MIELHFCEKKDLPSDWNDVSGINKEYAEQFRDFLIQEDKERTEFQKEHKDFFLPDYFPIAECFTFSKKIDNNHSKTVTFLCLEYEYGNQMYLDWKWNTPEVQKSYTESKVAGKDWYKQFETNPDGAVDYLDNLQDRTKYNSEFEKIEYGKKVGRHENH